MLGREPASLKLYGTLARSDLASYLESMGWAGERGAIEHALASLYPAELLGDELFVDLNLDTLGDPERCSLGLAASQQHVLHGPDQDPTRGRLLEVWSAAGLCDPTKVERARAWPGPADSAGRNPGLARFLDLKLVWQAGGGFSAKAYAGARSARRMF
jgi:hypothetical protein